MLHRQPTCTNRRKTMWQWSLRYRWNSETEPLCADTFLQLILMFNIAIGTCTLDGKVATDVITAACGIITISMLLGGLHIFTHSQLTTKKWNNFYVYGSIRAIFYSALLRLPWTSASLSIFSALYAIARPSVCLFVTQVDQSKTVQAIRSCNFHYRVVPWLLVSSRLTSLRNSKGNIGSGGADWQRGRKNTQFLASRSKSLYLRNGARYDQGYYDRLLGSRICAFDWHQIRWPWMTLNCYKFQFSRNFALLRIFGRQQWLN